MTILTWLAENWYIIVVGFIFGFTCVTNKNKIQEWLKVAVSKTEEEMGSGTGQLKLRAVYDMFIKNFPILSSIIPFHIFSKMVDLALEWMKDQMDKNNKIKEFIEK